MDARTRRLALTSLLAALACSNDGDDVDALLVQHGFACISFWAHEVFPATATIEAAITYEQCLVDFYTDVPARWPAWAPMHSVLAVVLALLAMGPRAA